MGTADPLVRIEAATLAGGDNNQDRHAYGDGWAFVLDGASSFSETPLVHDGGWYAERLKDALSLRLKADTATATQRLVADAIAEASSAHDSATDGPCPTSTIALARWGEGHVELYVLGDSFATWKNHLGIHELTDERIAAIGRGLRTKYRSRLAQGFGFDEGHRQILARLQHEQACNRNRPGGYWIAGDYPPAALRGQSALLAMQPDLRLLLSTDGVARENRYETLARSLTEHLDLNESLSNYQEIEGLDPNGVRNPRSKVHDDKTLVRICWV